MTAKPSFTAEEKAAMKERARELKSQATAAEGLADVQAKIAEMPQRDQVIANRLHEIVAEHAPTLLAKTWYGQPAYTKDGVVVMFFQSSAKFNTRYSTLGFSDAAQLDDGSMWPSSYAITQLTPSDEKTIVALVKKAVG